MRATSGGGDRVGTDAADSFAAGIRAMNSSTSSRNRLFSYTWPAPAPAARIREESCWTTTAAVAASAASMRPLTTSATSTPITPAATSAPAAETIPMRAERRWVASRWASTRSSASASWRGRRHAGSWYVRLSVAPAAVDRTPSRYLRRRSLGVRLCSSR